MLMLMQTYGVSRAVADFGGTRVAPPLGTQILSISFSFRENLAKLYVGTPPPWGNPRSAAAEDYYYPFHDITNNSCPIVTLLASKFPISCQGDFIGDAQMKSDFVQEIHDVAFIPTTSPSIRGVATVCSLL